jgi:hypothetical protein
LGSDQSVDEGTSLCMRVWSAPDEARVITPPAFDQLAFDKQWNRKPE